MDWKAAEKVCKKLFRVFYSRDENPKHFCLLLLTVTYFFSRVENYEKMGNAIGKQKKKKKKTEEEEEVYDVVVLGAGISGLSCARCLLFASSSSSSSSSQKMDKNKNGGTEKKKKSRGNVMQSVCVVEAQSEVGGRVKQSAEIAPWSVELGAEFVHGEERNPVRGLALSDACCGGTPDLKFSHFEWPDRYAMATKTTTSSCSSSRNSSDPPEILEIVDGDECEKNDKDVWKIHQLFDRLPGVSKTSRSNGGNDDDDDDDKAREEDPMSSLSALEWLRDVQKCTEREIRVAELIYATDFGASLRDIGMREIMIEKERWRNGEQYLVLNGGFNELFQRAFLDEFESRKSSSSSSSNNNDSSGNDGVVDVRLNWEVKTVEKERDLIKVTGTSFGKRKTLHAKKVVVSLPLPMYRPMLAEKKNISRVTFHPPLSEEKQKALRAVKMGNAVKVLLGFNEKFWPQEDLFNVICDLPAPFPEFWIVSDKEKTITRKEEEEDGGVGGANKKSSKKGDVRFVITFFITGDRANAMAKINPKKRIDLAFKQFVGITLQTSDEKEFERIRAKHLKTSETKVWSEERFAGGSYTHPSVGCTRKTREILAKSEWSNTLFFCGEGTNTSVNPCLQGAYETGVRAANEILKVSST